VMVMKAPRSAAAELDAGPRPRTGGACVVTALKQERTRLPRLRVLVHTRHTSPADDTWALAAGCDGVLHKPGSADALVREVRRLEGHDSNEPGSGTGDGTHRP
jgi:DNA-binding NarL/FixJ family response regulator